MRENLQYAIIHFLQDRREEQKAQNRKIIIKMRVDLLGGVQRMFCCTVVDFDILFASVYKLLINLSLRFSNFNFVYVYHRYGKQ